MNNRCYDYGTYLSPLTWRYGSQEMRRIWSEEHKRRLWRRIWVALAEAQHEAGLVTAEQLADLRAHEDQVDVARAHEIEAEIHHDKMAEVRAFAEQCPVGGGIIHLGATSADVEDNADVLRLRESLLPIREKLTALLRAFAAQIERRKDQPCMGYTHLQPAEPTTLGYRLCQYAQELLIDWRNLDRLLGDLKGKGFKGAVGTSASYAQLLQGSGLTSQDLERRVMERLGLEAFPVATQTYPRKQDWLVLNALATVAQSLHKFAFDLRVLQAPLFGEWSEPFRARQVGSSAMPFKRNPVIAETICSLARYVAALPPVAWHNAADSLLERTLDDSANRRLILPQAFLAVDAMLGLARRIVEGLVVQDEAVARNLAIYGPFAATEALLMELVKAGADRQAMHELIRQHAMASWEAIQRGEENPLRGRLRADEMVLSYLGAKEVDALLDVSGYVGDAPARCEAFLRLLEETLS
jgi:adenylosuccinate lyase